MVGVGHWISLFFSCSIKTDGLSLAGWMKIDFFIVWNFIDKIDWAIVKYSTWRCIIKIPMINNCVRFVLWFSFKNNNFSSLLFLRIRTKIFENEHMYVHFYQLVYRKNDDVRGMTNVSFFIIIYIPRQFLPVSIWR